MKDAMLLALINCAELEEPHEQDVTLVVGGFLISGKVITYAEYVAQNPITAAVAKSYEEADKELSEAEAAKLDKTPNFIHLRDAKYYTPGQQPIPGNMGVYVRVPLDAVQAHNLGSLSASSN